MKWKLSPNHQLSNFLQDLKLQLFTRGSYSSAIVYFDCSIRVFLGQKNQDLRKILNIRFVQAQFLQQILTAVQSVRSQITILTLKSCIWALVDFKFFIRNCVGQECQLLLLTKIWSIAEIHSSSNFSDGINPSRSQTTICYCKKLFLDEMPEPSTYVLHRCPDWPYRKKLLLPFLLLNVLLKTTCWNTTIEVLVSSLHVVSAFGSEPSSVFQLALEP